MLQFGLKERRTFITCGIAFSYSLREKKMKFITRAALPVAEVYIKQIVNQVNCKKLGKT